MNRKFSRYIPHIVAAAVCLLILLPTATCVVLGMRNSRLKEENRALLAGGQGTVIPTQGQMPPTAPDAPEDAPPQTGEAGEAELPYQQLYPTLYAQRPEQMRREEHVMYLTFDDGPSERTVQVLDTLQQYGIKATFFVTGKDDDFSRSVMKRIVDEGHTIAIHTYTHSYTDIYQSVDAYLQDFERIYNLIEEVTGVKATMFRFPGGSVNSYNGQVYQELIAEMTRRGFVFYDWNISAGDATHKATQQSITNSVVNGGVGKKRGIVLMHDSKPMADTANALPAIIQGLQAEGFYFDKLTNDVLPITFPYPNPFR